MLCCCLLFLLSGVRVAVFMREPRGCRAVQFASLCIIVFCFWIFVDPQKDTCQINSIFSSQRSILEISSVAWHRKFLLQTTYLPYGEAKGPQGCSFNGAATIDVKQAKTRNK